MEKQKARLAAVEAELALLNNALIRLTSLLRRLRTPSDGVRGNVEEGHVGWSSLHLESSRSSNDSIVHTMGANHGKEVVQRVRVRFRAKAAVSSAGLLCV